jgi:hypothetical protein
MVRSPLEVVRTPLLVLAGLMLTTPKLIPAEDRVTQMTSSRTVFVLVDESGTLRADREGWRQEAIELLAYALPNGSSFALSGFGNPERRLALDLLRFDDTESGQKARRVIAERAARLSSEDRYTDLYGAIQHVITKVASLDKAVLRAAPPALILLTDFEADPPPDPEKADRVCRSIRESGIELIAVGFGKVNAAAQSYVAGCADTMPVASLTDPSDLVDTFWKVARRLSRYIRVRDLLVHPSTPAQLPVPDWATEVAVLAFSPDTTVSDWHWEVNGVSPSVAGRYFRACRIPVKNTRRVSITMTGNRPVQLSVGARGDVVLGLTSQTPEPWLRNETIPFAVQLKAASSGKVVDEWTHVEAASHAAWLRMDDQPASPMEINRADGSFSAPLLLSQAGPHRFIAAVLVDGTPWRAETRAIIRPFPMQQSDGALRTWAWVPGSTKLELTTDLGPREFTASCLASENLGHTRATAGFGPSSPTQIINIRAGDAAVSFAGNWFKPLDPITGTIQMDIQLQTGQIVTGFNTPVVVSFVPLWVRLSISAVPVALLAVAIRGRRLPPWHLLRLDGSWKPIPGEVVRLRTHRRRIDLSGLGLPGTAIRTPLIGKTFVQLGQNTAVCAQGNRELRYNSARKILRPGDVISRRDSFGNESSFRVEKL